MSVDKIKRETAYPIVGQDNALAGTPVLGHPGMIPSWGGVERWVPEISQREYGRYQARSGGLRYVHRKNRVSTPGNYFSAEVAIIRTCTDCCAEAGMCEMVSWRNHQSTPSEDHEVGRPNPTTSHYNPDVIRDLARLRVCSGIGVFLSKIVHDMHEVKACTV